MYTNSGPTPRHSAASTQAQSGHIDKGKGRARDSASELPYLTPHVSPRQRGSIGDGWGGYPMAPGAEERPSSTLSVGIEVPLSMPQSTRPTLARPPLTKNTSSYLYPILNKKQLSTIPQSPTAPAPADPSFFKLPPVRERVISAPIQPRVTDVRVHMERDAQSTNPRFHVDMSFTFTMQPGELP